MAKKTEQELDDEWLKQSVDEKMKALGFDTGPEIGPSLSTDQRARLDEVLNAFAGATSLVDEIDEETQGSDCEVCKRIQAALSEE